MKTKINKTLLKQTVQETVFKLIAKSVAEDEWFDVDTLEVDLENNNNTLYKDWSDIYEETARYNQLVSILNKFNAKFHGSAYDFDPSVDGTIIRLLVRTKDVELVSEVNKLALEKYKEDTSLSAREHFYKIAKEKNLYFIEF